MCPLCASTAVLIAFSVTTSGGLAAFAIMKFGRKDAADNQPVRIPTKEDRHG
jgi:hypothetical protein